MPKNYFRKDWILYEEIANHGGRAPQDLIPVTLKTDDAIETNKHIPFIIENEEGYTVKTGKNEFHAVTEEHNIVFIALYIDNKYEYKQYFNNGDTPEAVFKVPKGKKVEAVAFCNLHGMFKFTL